MSSWRTWLIDRFHFDAKHEFWLPDWGEQPDDPDELREVIAQQLAQVPALIPIYAHRAIPNEPLEAGNPVFSMWQAVDTIVYGTDLADYLLHEFPPPVWRFWESRRDYSGGRENGREIRFWTDLLDAG